MLIKPVPDKKIKTLYSNLIPTVVTVICLLYSLNAKAQGDLFINPKRVVFEGQNRSSEINLANIGKDTARYIVSFTQIRMKADGNFEQIAKPDSGQYFASDYLRIFPRTVILAPKESQIIKIQLLQGKKMLPGEYRSHLYFRGVPSANPLGENLAKEPSKNVSVRLVPVFGISIPVIIRVGENNANLSISNLEFQKQENSIPTLKLRFNRTGNMSIYGDITVEHISDEGKITKAGHLKGISVYTPNKLRNVTIKLNNEEGINYRSGKLNVIYTRPSEEKSEKLASAELLLN